MKYSVTYTFFDTTYQAVFDDLNDAKIFALMKDLQVSCHLCELKEGEFDRESGYFSGTVRFIDFKNN